MNIILNEIKESFLEYKIFQVEPFKSFIEKILFTKVQDDFFPEIKKAELLIMNKLKNQINTNIFDELSKELFRFMFIAKAFEQCRKGGLKKIYESSTTEDDYYTELDQFLNKNMIFLPLPKLRIHPFSFGFLKQLTPAKLTYKYLTKFKYFERDIFIVYLNDLYKEHQPKKYYKDFNYIIKIISEYYPLLFRNMPVFKKDMDHEFYSFMNKVEKRIKSKS